MKKRIVVALIGLFVLAGFHAPGAFAQDISPAPPPPPPGVQSADTVSIPAGTSLQAQLTTILSTKTSKNGDPFAASVAEPFIVKGEEVVPIGSLIDGHVSMVKQPGRVTGVAEMRLVADSITTPDGVKFTVSAGLQDAEGAGGAKVKGNEGTIKGSGKSRKGEVVETGVGAGVGAGIGAIADGGMGSLYGLGIGAATGIIHSLSKRHPDIILPQGTELTFVISRTTTAKKALPKPAEVGSQ